MDRNTESPRFVLVLGSLFIMAYAAFMLGTAWMQSVNIPEISAIQIPTLTSAPEVVYTATLTPTSVPLYWVSPTITIGVQNYSSQTTQTPSQVSLTLTLSPFTATQENTINPATITPSVESNKSTPTTTLTLSSTDEPYPGPEETQDPYPGPVETDNPYPGPEISSTPRPSITITPTTSNPDLPSVTPSLTSNPQPTESNLTPTQTATSMLPTATVAPLYTLPFTETLVISNGEVNQVIWSQDALTLTMATSDGVYLVNADTLQLEKIFDQGATISSVTFALNDGLIAAGGADALIRWWDPEFHEYLGFLQGHLLGVVRVGVPNYGSFLASGSDDATVRIWDISSLYNLGVDSVQLKFAFFDPQNRVTDLAVSEIGEIVAASSNQYVHIWNSFTGELIKTIFQPNGWYTALALSVNEQELVTAFDGRRLEFWDTLNWERTKFLPLNGTVKVIAYSNDGEYLALGYENGRIQILDAGLKIILADVAGHDGLTNLSFSPDSVQLASSSENGTVRIWELAQLESP